MEFTIDEAKKAQLTGRSGGDQIFKLKKQEKFLRSMQHACVVIGIAAAVLRIVQVTGSGGSLSNGLVMGGMDLLFFGVVSMILRSMANGAASRAEACQQKETLKLEDDFLQFTVESQSGSKSIGFDLQKAEVYYDEASSSVLLVGGVLGEEEPASRKANVCDLQLVDYFVPSLRETLLDQGIAMEDWKNRSSGR